MTDAVGSSDQDIDPMTQIIFGVLIDDLQGLEENRVKMGHLLELSREFAAWVLHSFRGLVEESKGDLVVEVEGFNSYDVFEDNIVPDEIADKAKVFYKVSAEIYAEAYKHRMNVVDAYKRINQS